MERRRGRGRKKQGKAKTGSRKAGKAWWYKRRMREKLVERRKSNIISIQRERESALPWR